MRILPQWDVSYTVLGLVLFFLLSAATIERTGRAWLWAGFAGLTAGLLSPGQSRNGIDLDAVGALPDLVQASSFPTRAALRRGAGCDGGVVQSALGDS